MSLGELEDLGLGRWDRVGNEGRGLDERGRGKGMRGEAVLGSGL